MARNEACQMNALKLFRDIAVVNCWLRSLFIMEYRVLKYPYYLFVLLYYILHYLNVQENIDFIQQCKNEANLFIGMVIFINFQLLYAVRIFLNKRKNNEPMFKLFLSKISLIAFIHYKIINSCKLVMYELLMLCI
jgi:hypothetical protein